MRLAEPGERFVIVAGPRAGATGTAIDFLSPGWELMSLLVVGHDRSPTMWVEVDGVSPNSPPPQDPAVLGLDWPPDGAYPIPQRWLMRIDPDDDTRREADEELTREEGVSA